MARALLAPFVLLFILALAARSSQGSVERSVSATAPAEEPRTEVTGTGTGETTVEVAAHAGETEGRSEAPFGSRPKASGGSSYEADAVLAVRHGVHEWYERVVLDLGTGEEPAETVPEWILRASPKGGCCASSCPR